MTKPDANLIWGANALLLSFLLLAPRWRWPAYLAAGIAAMVVGSALVGESRAINLLYNALNLVEVMIGAFLLRRKSTQLPRFTDSKYLVRFIAYAVLAGPIVAGSLLALVMAIWRHTPPMKTLFDWVIGDGLGAAIVVPTFVAIFQTRFRNLSLRRHWFYPFVLAVVTLAAFSQDQTPFLLLILPFLVLVLMRLGLGFAALATLVIATTASWFTIRGSGPFAISMPSGPLHGVTPLTVETPVTEAVRLGRAVVPDAMELEERFPVFAHVLHDRGWRTYGVFPVEAGGVVCGALTVAAAPEGWLTSDRRDVLVPLSAQIGVALGRALLYQESQAARLRQQVLVRLAATLDRVMGFQDRADAAATHLVRNGLELVRIHHLDEDGELQLVASAGVRRADARMRRLDQLARQVAETGDTALVSGEPEGTFATGRGAVAALHVRGRLLGTLTLRLPESSQLGMTTAFADEVASRLSHSLDNAMRYERERDVSHTLQAGLLGPAPAAVEGAQIGTVYRPGSEGLDVGGDWYDVFRLGDTTLALVVGDVVGHGLDAAVAMGQLRGAVRALAPTGSPSRVLDALDLFVEQVPQAAMATLAYAELDLQDGALTYACAGHPPPLLHGPDGCRLLWEGRSLPLGASFAGHQRTQALDRLAAGETILLYTDGLVEDRGRGISAGLDLLLEVAAEADGAAPSAFVESIVGRLVAAIDSQDDVCMLALRRSSSTARFVHVFPASPGEVRRMRQALSVWLEATGLDDHKAHDVVLAVSEAAANSVEHGYHFDSVGNVRVEAWENDGSLHVAVHDTGAWRTPPERSERGRGRAIMEALMRDVGFETENGGTVVRMRLPLAGRQVP